MLTNLEPALATLVRSLLEIEVLPSLETVLPDGNRSTVFGDAPPPGPIASPLPARWQAVPLGKGGMGEVFRVLDAHLERQVALKTVRSTTPGVLERFLREAHTTAQLQHPGIISVHSLGTLPDGRPYYTMPVVEGVEFTVHLQQHRSSGTPSLRQLIRTLRRACDPLGYAHSRGVVHRDIKPENIMIGAHGEVLVLDWGIARSTLNGPRGDDPTKTAAVGTPLYMAPEQILGNCLSPATDVYALGVVLYQILNGRTPRLGSVADVLLATQEDALIPPSAGPSPLADLVEACLSHNAMERPQDAAQVGQVLESWLDGAIRAEEAGRLVEQAVRSGEAAAEAKAVAERLSAQAVEQLDAIGLFADETKKAEAWALEDAARAHEDTALRLGHQVELTLRTALMRHETHLGARRALAAHFASAHRRAEQGRDNDAARRARIALEAEIEQLPERDRSSYQAYLEGEGRLVLESGPSGARVTAHRFVQEGRRLVEGPGAVLGHTPLDVPLGFGSWVLRIEHPDCEPTIYPVQIDRGAQWEGSVDLQPAGSLGPEDRYVPAGWFVAGGDRQARLAIPRTRMWCHGFVMRRALITNTEYLVFLDDLVEQGREEDAVRFSPTRLRQPHGDREGPASAHPTHFLYRFSFGASFEVPESGSSTGTTQTSYRNE